MPRDKGIFQTSLALGERISQKTGSGAQPGTKTWLQSHFHSADGHIQEVLRLTGPIGDTPSSMHAVFNQQDSPVRPRLQDLQRKKAAGKSAADDRDRMLANGCNHLAHQYPAAEPAGRR